MYIVTHVRLINFAYNSGLLMDVTKTGGNGEWRIGNGEQGFGNKCTAVTCLIIQNGRQRKRKGNNLGNCEEVLQL